MLDCQLLVQMSGARVTRGCSHFETLALALEMIFLDGFIDHGGAPLSRDGVIGCQWYGVRAAGKMVALSASRAKSRALPPFSAGKVDT